MKTNDKIKVMVATALASLTVGMIASAQNIDVKGTTYGEGNAYFYQQVGIGTTTPGYKLNIAGDSGWTTSASLQLTEGSIRNWLVATGGVAGTGNFTIYNGSIGQAITVAGASNYVGISNPTPTAPLTLPSATTAVDMIDFPYTGNMKHSIYAQTYGGVSANNWLEFRIWNGNATTPGQATPLHLDGNGAVGISVTSPSAALHVQKSGTTGQVGMIVQSQYNNAADIFRVVNENNTVNYLSVVNGGNVGVGTASPAQKLDIGGGWINLSPGYGIMMNNTSVFSTRDGSSTFVNPYSAAGGTFLGWDRGNGVTYVGNGTGGYGTVNAGAFAVASSRRFKKDIRNAHYGLAALARLQPKTYRYIKDPKGKLEIGFIAEEMAEVIPEVVGRDQLGQPNGIDYSKLSVVLTQAVKEQQAQMKAQQAQIQSYEDKFKAEEALLGKAMQRIERLEAGGGR